jgi:hypothetical protein
VRTLGTSRRAFATALLGLASVGLPARTLWRAAVPADRVRILRQRIGGVLPLAGVSDGPHDLLHTGGPILVSVAVLSFAASLAIWVPGVGGLVACYGPWRSESSRAHLRKPCFAGLSYFGRRLRRRAARASLRACFRASSCLLDADRMVRSRSQLAGSARNAATCRARSYG